MVSICLLHVSQYVFNVYGMCTYVYIYTHI